MGTLRQALPDFALRDTGNGATRLSRDITKAIRGAVVNEQRGRKRRRGRVPMADLLWGSPKHPGMPFLLPVLKWGVAFTP